MTDNVTYTFSCTALYDALLQDLAREGKMTSKFIDKVSLKWNAQLSIDQLTEKVKGTTDETAAVTPEANLNAASSAPVLATDSSSHNTY